MKDQIIFYDNAHSLYYSYYVTGFLLARTGFNYSIQVSRDIPIWLKIISEFRKEPFINKHLSVFQCKTPKKDFYFCIDASDTGHIQLEYLPNVRFYFKVNYSQEQIRIDDSLKRSRRKIIPALPFFPIRPPRWPILLLPLKLKDARWWMKYLAKRRFWEFRQGLFALNLDDFIRYRTVPKVYDIFFVMSFNSQKQHHYMNEFRYDIMRTIQETPQCRSVVGFTSPKKMPAKFEKLRVKRFNYKEYVQHLSKSKIGIYVRGNHDCISVKFGHLLSLGIPIAGQTFGFNAKELYANPNFNQQFNSDDPLRIASNALHLLESPDQMKMLSESNSDTFDKTFSPQAVAADLLLKMKLSLH